MHVNVSFTLDIDPNEWEGRLTGVPVAVNVSDERTAERIRKEVRAHAEEVVRNLYFDMGLADRP